MQYWIVGSAGVAERTLAGTRRSTLLAKVAKMRVVEERGHGQRAVARKEAMAKIKWARVTAESVRIVGNTGHTAAMCPKNSDKPCMPSMKTKTIVKKHITKMNNCKRGVR